MVGRSGEQARAIDNPNSSILDFSPWPDSEDGFPTNFPVESPNYTFRLLGPFELKHQGKPVQGLKSAKVRGLLAYLVVESNLPQHRSILASLFWPNWSDKDALTNLRSSLYNLRRVLHDRPLVDRIKHQVPYLLSDNQTVQFNTAANDFWVDVWVFDRLTSGVREEIIGPERYQQAVQLYRSDFLQGFFLKDCLACEEWITLKREAYSRKMTNALSLLADCFEMRGQYEEADKYIRKLLEMEPWNETAYQRLMRVLYLSGNRASALTQFKVCREMLANDLGVEPLAETILLYNDILAGSLKPKAPTLEK